MMDKSIVVIGAGPVGLFTIFQAGMLGMRCHVIDIMDVVGGQCVALYPEKPIYDIPSHEKISAAELIDRLAAQAKRFNPIYHLGQKAISCKKYGDEFVVTTDKGTVIQCAAVVIAAGAGAFGPNRPPMDNIEKYEGKSVFYFVSQKEQFRDMSIAIAGGGDSAVDWALSLESIAKKIYLIHRRNKFRAMDDSINKLYELSSAANSKLELVVPYQLHSLVEKNGELTGVTVADLDGNKRLLAVNVLLTFFGLATDLSALESWGLNIKGYHIPVDRSTYETNISGIYAIGDVATYDNKLKLILTGFAEAATCLHHAYTRVFKGKALHFEHSTSSDIFM